MKVVASNVVATYNQQIIKNALQLFSWKGEVKDCSNGTKYFKGSDQVNDYLFNRCIQALPVGEYVIDTKVHMLKPGWLPCIGGWHFDEIDRDQDGNLQFDTTDSSREHYLIILDAGTGSLTEFLRAQFFPQNLAGYKVKTFKDLNDLINKNPNVERYTVESNNMYQFGVFEAHRGQQATGSGWRYFFRATKNSKRSNISEVRAQSQVYIPEDRWEYGW